MEPTHRNSPQASPVPGCLVEAECVGWVDSQMGRTARTVSGPGRPWGVMAHAVVGPGGTGGAGGVCGVCMTVSSDGIRIQSSG